MTKKVTETKAIDKYNSAQDARNAWDAAYNALGSVIIVGALYLALTTTNNSLKQARHNSLPEDRRKYDFNRDGLLERGELEHLIKDIKEQATTNRVR